MVKKLLYLTLMFCFISSNVYAANNATYSVDVSVDVTDDNAAIAKDKAMTKANREAFNTVVNRLTNGTGSADLEKLNDTQILNFIKEISIKSEKSSSVRYIADLNVVVDDNLLSQYMREKGISTVVVPKSDILIVPTFREFKTDTPMLWEKENLWKSAWEEARGDKRGMVTFTAIPANGSNYASIDAKKALSLDNTAMQQIAFHNNIHDIYVADAYYNGIEGLTVTVYSYKNGSVETFNVSGVRSPELLQQAVKETKNTITNKLKKQNFVEYATKNSIEVVYNYNNMADWAKTERALKEVSQVSGIRVMAMSRGKVQFKVDFSGSTDSLITSLNRHYFSLNSQGSYYILKRI